MYYWIIVNESTGAFGTGSATQPQDESLAPNGFTYVEFPDSLDSTTQAAFSNPQAYLYQNGAFVANPDYNTDAVALAQAQQAQLAAINTGYNTQMNSGFTSNATGTLDTYAIDPISMGKWTGILAVINSGIGPSTQTVKDLAGNQVTLTSTQFKQFALDGLNFFNAQEQQLWALEGQINAQTSVPTTPVTWTPGAYTPQPAPTTS